MTIHCYSDPSPDAWKAFIAVMHSGEVFECDEEMWFYWLEVLPPAWMRRLVTLPDNRIVSTFGFAEGPDLVTAFWREGPEDATRYFGIRTNIINPRPCGDM